MPDPPAGFLNLREGDRLKSAPGCLWPEEVEQGQQDRSWRQAAQAAQFLTGGLLRDWSGSKGLADLGRCFY
jgi:hypothetical protein